VRTFKIERIERAELLDEAYDLPPDLDLESLLKNAWGIWFTERDPVEVALRFHPRVARRVAETRWHPSERVIEMSDGGLLWRAQVAEPQEMLPWIRGWGADVEVLEPESLRLSIAAEIELMRGIYQR
jgi:predicted DNA-binding transcriptional regulator YafY